MTRIDGGLFLPGDMPEGLDFAVAQLFRDSCSRCGYGHIQWFRGFEAPALIGETAAIELLSWLPPVEAMKTACWYCPMCGECAAFGMDLG